MDADKLHSWALSAVQELQEFCDDAQVAAGNPDGEDQLLGVRALISEFDEIEHSYGITGMGNGNNKISFFSKNEFGSFSVDASVLGLTPRVAPTFHPMSNEIVKWNVFYIDINGEKDIHGWDYLIGSQRYIVWND